MAHKPLLPTTEFMTLPIPTMAELPDSYQFTKDIPVPAHPEFKRANTQTFPKQ